MDAATAVLWPPASSALAPATRIEPVSPTTARAPNSVPPTKLQPAGIRFPDEFMVPSFPFACFTTTRGERGRIGSAPHGVILIRRLDLLKGVGRTVQRTLPTT